MADTPFTVNDIDNRPVIATREQARDFRVYEQLRNEATRRGVQLQIVSDEQFADLMGSEPQPRPTPVRPETDGTLELGGRKVLPIRESDARNFPQYTVARGKADALGVPLRIVGDNAFLQPATSSGAVGEGVHIASDGTKCWQIPKSTLRDVAKYQAAKVRAAEQGLDLLIVNDAMMHVISYAEYIGSADSAGSD